MFAPASGLLTNKQPLIVHLGGGRSCAPLPRNSLLAHVSRVLIELAASSSRRLAIPPGALWETVCTVAWKGGAEQFPPVPPAPGTLLRLLGVGLRLRLQVTAARRQSERAIAQLARAAGLTGARISRFWPERFLLSWSRNAPSS